MSSSRQVGDHAYDPSVNANGDTALPQPTDHELRTNRLTPAAAPSPALKFHGLRHTYASLCVAVGIPVRTVCRFMGHNNPNTTETIYTHLFNTDDYSDEMAALGVMATGRHPSYGGKVIPLRR